MFSFPHSLRTADSRSYLQIEIPPFVEITASITATVTFSNSMSTATTFTSTNAQTQTITLQNEAGKTCSLTFDVQTCDASGSGSIHMLASGWAWVYCGERREGHYKVRAASISENPCKVLS